MQIRGRPADGIRDERPERAVRPQLAVEAVDGTLTLMSTGFDEAVFEFPAADVPEPATLSLLAVGGAVAGARRRLRR